MDYLPAIILDEAWVEFERECEEQNEPTLAKPLDGTVGESAAREASRAAIASRATSAFVGVGRMTVKPIRTWSSRWMCMVSTVSALSERVQ